MATIKTREFKKTHQTGWNLSSYKPSYSDESRALSSAYTSAVSHYAEPITAPQSTHDKFYSLFYSWKYDTLTLSSPTQIAIHPSYQAIIGMGKLALPYIFKEMLVTTDYWFWALKAITGKDPVPAGERGKIAKMHIRWLIWGRENGYI